MQKKLVALSFVIMTFYPVSTSANLDGCLSATNCNSFDSGLSGSEIDLEVDSYIWTLESGNLRSYPPGPERQACEAFCHKTGEDAGRYCRMHVSSSDRAMCWARLNDAVATCIRDCL